MKNCIIISIAILFATWFLSCEKEEGNGNILVTVNYNGQAVSQAGIYLKRGNDTINVVPPPEFDKQTGADAIGQAYFSNLQPDVYTLFAKGYCQQKGGLVKGKAFVTVKQRYRQNEYNVTIEAQ